MRTKRRRAIRLLDALPEDGERRLMLAVLLDAIRIVRNDPLRERRVRARRARERELAWFEAEDHSAPFSFTSICNALGLNAGYVRRCALRPSDNPWPVRRIAHIGSPKAC